MTRSQHTAALRARDDGLRRVRKITWRIGLVEGRGACHPPDGVARLAASALRVGLPSAGGRPVPPDLESLARRAVASCPALALLLERSPATARERPLRV